MMLDKIPPEVNRLSRALPRFPDGRINYTSATEAVVVDCYVLRQEELLILKRRNQIAGSMTPWHVVAGYLDQACTLRQKALEEVVEETGVTQICSMEAIAPYVHVDVKAWTVYPVAVRIFPGSEIRLNEEHTEFAWIKPNRVSEYLLPQVCDAFMKFRM